MTPDVLRILMEHMDAAGDPARTAAAFQAAGRDWGFRDEQRGADGRASSRARLVEGLRGLTSLGLAAATLDSFNFSADQDEWYVSCTIRPTATATGRDDGEDAPRARCDLAIGYLLGWLTSLTGVEVDCDPPGGDARSPDLKCLIRPAPPKPEGDARPSLGPKSLEGGMSDLGIELTDLIELTLDTIVFLDSEGTVRYWNRGAAYMFGYQRDEVLGRNIRFLIPRDLLQSGELEQLKKACKADGVVFDHTTRRVRKDGSTIWVSLTRTVSHDHLGREVGVVATMRDITAHRDREQELQRSRSLALVGELAAKVAHEVKNPLAGIYAALQVLEGQLEPTDPRREVFNSIGEEVMRLNDITQDLLNFARPPEPTLRKADLGKFLRDLVGDLERLSMASPGEVDVAGLERGLKVPFDPNLTGQVFKNLIMNGMQANAGSGTVRLSSRRHGDNVAIDVADSGPGIKKEDHASIFEPFFTTKSRGTGLGLSIAKKNVEAQGGSIRVRSHRGRGAIFRVEFQTN